MTSFIIIIMEEETKRKEPPKLFDHYPEDQIGEINK
jgi:hypothetical protein